LKTFQPWCNGNFDARQAGLIRFFGPDGTKNNALDTKALGLIQARFKTDTGTQVAGLPGLDMTMKTLYCNLRLIFSGDTVLLVFSILLFLASMANVTHWPALRAFRFCGICTLLLSLTFFLLSSVEIFKHQRQHRTIIAALLFLAATVLCLSNGHFVIERAQ
jgi:hypothetical protein